MIAVFIMWMSCDSLLGKTNIDGTGTVTEPGLSEDKYNYGIINVTFSGGSVGFYEAGWGSSLATDNSKEFIGSLGRIQITYQKDRPSHH